MSIFIFGALTQSLQPAMARSHLTLPRRWTNNGPRVARASGGSDFTHKELLFSRTIVDSRARNKEFIGIKLAVIEVDPDYEWLAPYSLQTGFTSKRICHLCDGVEPKMCNVNLGLINP